MKRIVRNLCYPLFVVLVILLIWWIAALVINVDLILPTPTVAIHNLFIYIGQQDFWLALSGTFLRGIVSFIISFLTAILFAFGAFLSPTLKKIIQPFMSIVRSIPTMSVILILIIWLSPKTAPLVVAIIVICPTIYSSLLAGFEEIDVQLIEMAAVYNVSRGDKIKKLYLPNIAPTMFETSASGLGLNIKLVIAAEALTQTSDSIGKLMQYAKISLEIEKLFALTIAAVLLSTACEFIIRLIARRVVRWKYVKV